MTESLGFANWPQEIGNHSWHFSIYLGLLHSNGWMWKQQWQLYNKAEGWKGLRKALTLCIQVKNSFYNLYFSEIQNFYMIVTEIRLNFL